MKAWNTIQFGLEQQDPQSWSEIARQPLIGNQFMANEMGVQWGTKFRSNMRWWSKKNFKTLQDQTGWIRLENICRTPPPSLHKCCSNIIRLGREQHPLGCQPHVRTPHMLVDSIKGGWLVYSNGVSLEEHFTTKSQDLHENGSEELHLIDHRQPIPARPMWEVRVFRCGGNKRAVLDYNPQYETKPEQSLWLWGNDWISNLEWDPQEWQWRRLGILPDT